MSRWLNRARRRARDGEAGFTLIEIMVAITLVAIAAGGAIPLLIVGMKAANSSKLNTQAKNIAQQRMESMRDLPFHVDRQNGPFVDLLDIYYTNVSTTSTSRTRAGETEVGRWISSGAASPAPSGPVYKVTVDSIPGFTNFSQTIYSQFLTVTGSALAASTFSTYDSQTEGKDQPPTLMLGVTVVTTWNDHGSSHSYTSYTRIADSRGLASNVTSQGSASFLRLTSVGEAGNALTVDLASADASGGLSTGSVAAADIRALQAYDSMGTDYFAASATATAPIASAPGTQPNPYGPVPPSGGACGWVEVGPTSYDNVTADVSSSGLPRVPTNVDTNSPPNNQVSAQVWSGGNTCAGIFGFSNQSSSYDPYLKIDDASKPLVSILNAGSNSVTVTGSAWVNATAPTANPHTVTSGGNTSSTKGVVLFPGVNNGNGVLKIKLTQSSIACTSSVSGGTTTQSSTGSYTVTISYWSPSSNAYVDLGTYTWNSATGAGSADPLASIDMSSIVVYQSGTTVRHLSDYIASWSLERSITENANSGVHQLQGIVSLSTQPVRAGDLMSSVGLQVGNLSCVADDNR